MNLHLRRRGFYRRGAAIEAAEIRHRAQARYPGRVARLQRCFLPGVRVLRRGHARLGVVVHVRVAGRWRSALGGVRAVAVPSSRTRCCRRGVLDRNRGGAYLSMFITGAGLFGTFFFLTYYMQRTLGSSPSLPASRSYRSAPVPLSPPICPRSCLCPGSCRAAGRARDADHIGRNGMAGPAGRGTPGT